MITKQQLKNPTNNNTTTMNQTQTTRTQVPSLIRMNAFNPDRETYAEYEACADERRRLLNDAATPHDLHQTLKRWHRLMYV